MSTIYHRNRKFFFFTLINNFLIRQYILTIVRHMKLKRRFLKQSFLCRRLSVLQPFLYWFTSTLRSWTTTTKYETGQNQHPYRVITRLNLKPCLVQIVSFFNCSVTFKTIFNLDLLLIQMGVNSIQNVTESCHCSILCHVFSFSFVRKWSRNVHFFCGWNNWSWYQTVFLLFKFPKKKN